MRLPTVRMYNKDKDHMIVVNTLDQLVWAAKGYSSDAVPSGERIEVKSPEKPPEENKNEEFEKQLKGMNRAELDEMAELMEVDNEGNMDVVRDRLIEKHNSDKGA